MCWPYQITRQVSYNTFELALPPRVRIHPRFNTLHLVPYNMGPQGVPDVVVTLEALPHEVLDGFNQSFLEDWQPHNALNDFEGAPPALLAHDYVPPVEAGSAYALRQLLLLVRYWTWRMRILHSLP